MVDLNILALVVGRIEEAMFKVGPVTNPNVIFNV